MKFKIHETNIVQLSFKNWCICMGIDFLLDYVFTDEGKVHDYLASIWLKKRRCYNDS